MKNLKFIILSLIFLQFSCDKEGDSTQEMEWQNLEKMHATIISNSMINTTQCTNPDQWSFIAIGSKSCGGGAGFIAYSLKINVSDFLKKVTNYTYATQAYNAKWGIASTCDIILPPSGVACLNGKPTLIYP